MGGKYVVSPLTLSLASHCVTASVVDFDHFRSHGVSVETNYIIEVNVAKDKKGKAPFKPFK